MSAAAANAFIVSYRDLVTTGRWDAPFHGLVQQHKEAIKSLEAGMSKADALAVANEIFEALPSHFRQVIAPLTRSQQRGSPNKESLLSALREYPYVALAVFRSLDEQVSAHFENEMADLVSKRLRLRENTQRANDAIKGKSR